ncbi:hypothetical protein GGR34_003696 [Microvirga flocculans]|uniref:Phage tail protein n=1 Tax=Microvirga flocculans TaxID=217168 RepID=A0A7W6IJ32_9HYPH|nr:phage tail protein [Microvirga flocculans]MBB4042011.1 hypothetical protein [Microvirga flocculans]
MARHDLLPTTYVPLEKGLSLGSDSYTTVDPNVTAMRGIKIVNPPPSFLPFLVYEYGLGELTPYVPNLYELIEEGIDWQRVRGTRAAVAKALGWLGYAAGIEEFSVSRQHWNYFQLALTSIVEGDANLHRIEGVTGLSVPLRSVFWRAFAGYDVRAMEYGRGRWGSKLWGSYSGRRVAPGQAKWSFGRRTDIAHAMQPSELQALGVWIAPAGAALTWGAFPWTSVPWTASGALARSVAMLEATMALIAGKPAWAVFLNAAGEVIGYRRARARWPVAQAINGIYRVNSTRYAIKPEAATILYLEAMTGFGDGFGTTATEVGFILGSQPAAGSPAGALWLPPGGLAEPGPIVARRSITIPFQRTVRERICAVLRF